MDIEAAIRELQDRVASGAADDPQTTALIAQLLQVLNTMSTNIEHLHARVAELERRTSR